MGRLFYWIQPGKEKLDGTNQARVAEEARLDQIGLDKSYFLPYYIRNGYIHHRYKERTYD